MATLKNVSAKKDMLDIAEYASHAVVDHSLTVTKHSVNAMTLNSTSITLVSSASQPHQTATHHKMDQIISATQDTVNQMDNAYQTVHHHHSQTVTVIVSALMAIHGMVYNV